MYERTKEAAWRLFGGLPAAFWWLWGSTFITQIANFVVPFCVLYFTADRHISTSVAGILAGLYGLGTVGGSLVGGIASDRFGSKRILVSGYAGTALCTMILGPVSGIIPLGAAMIFVGAFGGAARPATNTLTTELVPAESRVRVFALNYWAMNLGFAIACVCAGLIVQVGYVILFCVDGATTLLCATLVLLRVSSTATARDPARRSRSPRRPDTHRGSWLEPMRDRTFVMAVLMSVVTVALLQQLTVTLPLAMRASGHSPATYGSVAALNGVLVCCLQLPVSSLVTKRRLIQSLALGSGLLGLGLGLTAFAVSVVGYAVALAVWTVGEIVAAPAAPTLASHLARNGEQGKYQGVLAATWGVGAVVGPVAGTWIFAQGGGTMLWSVCAVAGFAVACGYLCLLRPVATRLAQPPESHQLQVETSML
jgi:MFS family permease